MRYERTDEAKKCRKAYEAHEMKHGYHELSELHPRMDGKTNTLSTVLKDNPVCEPVADICQVGSMPMPNGEPSTSAGFRVYSPDAKGRYLCANDGGAGAKTGLYALPVDEPMKVPEATKKGYAEIQNGECVDLTHPNSKTRRGRAMTDKSNCCMTSCQYYQYCAKFVYATPCEWDENGNPTKAISCADGKIYTVYKVENGQITIKDKQYPIKMVDGFYIIRKMTVTECKRLQTVPDSYIFPVSDTQAYKMLGNGWTVDVIVHILGHVPDIRTAPLEVFSMYDGMACGHIALDKLGGHITRYFATEIDKYAIQTTMRNFPDVIQMGDAFQVRDDGWRIPEAETVTEGKA